MICNACMSLLRYLRKSAFPAEKSGGSIEEEIAFHLGERTREYIEAGMSGDAAALKALEQFGNPSRIAATCHTADVRGLLIWHRLHVSMTVLLGIAVATFWFGWLMPGSQLGPPSAQLPPGIASLLDNDWSGDISGQVRDEHAKPIEGALVLIVVKTWPDESYFQRAFAVLSNADGRFLIENTHPVNERYAVQIAAIADNRVLKSSYHQRPKGILEPIVLELPPSSGLAVQVETDEGRNLAGVEVLPHGRIEADGAEHLVYFDSAQSLIRRTDLNGRLELPYFEPGDTATLLLRTSQGNWQSRKLLVPPTGEIAKIHAEMDE